jgi:predicted outer membrane lipoprotein
VAFAELLRKAIKVVLKSCAFTLWKKLWLDIMENEAFGRVHKFRGHGNLLNIPERPVVVRPHAEPPA